MAEERKGVRETRNAQKKWQITIVIKMAIWMIEGSLEERKEGRKEGHAPNERQKKFAAALGGGGLIPTE